MPFIYHFLQKFFIDAEVIVSVSVSEESLKYMDNTSSILNTRFRIPFQVYMYTTLRNFRLLTIHLKAYVKLTLQFVKKEIQHYTCWSFRI